MSKHHDEQQVRLNINTDKMTTSYANAFQTNATPEEIFLSFGVNLTSPPDEDGVAEMSLELSDRIIMNYYLAKRLAGTLIQIIQEHEARFGELELDPDKRLLASEGGHDGKDKIKQ